MLVSVSGCSSPKKTFSFFAFNQTNFHTKGGHNKWYYPWAVPSCFAADKAVTSEIYSNLADRFGSFYAGFRPKTQRLDSDSETGKISSAVDTWDEDGVERKKLKDRISVLRDSVIL